MVSSSSVFFGFSASTSSSDSMIGLFGFGLELEAGDMFTFLAKDQAIKKDRESRKRMLGMKILHDVIY